MSDENTLPKNCYVDPKYPNDAVCTGKTQTDITCDGFLKRKNDAIITMHYTKKNNIWSCNTKVGDCEVDQCKNIVYYNGDPCIILSNSSTDTFIDSHTVESVICMNTNNNIVKYDRIDSNWIIKTDPVIPVPQKVAPVKEVVPDPNITNYVEDDQTSNLT